MKNAGHRKAAMALVAGLLVGLGGCSVLTPKTAVSYSPLWGFSFGDTKDNDVEIVGLEVDPATKRIKCDKLTIRNNASDPIRENVEQMKVANEQLKTMGENARMIVAELGNAVKLLTPLAALFAPGVSASGPLGGNVDVSAGGLKAIIEGIVEAKLKERPKSPESQPADGG